jgi:predicted small metal-binding protein
VKVLYCRDAGFDCDAVVRGANDDEILAQVRSHAKEDHQLEVTPELEDHLKTLVREV